MSSSPTATEVGIVMAATSPGTTMEDGCAVKAQSISGSKVEEDFWEEWRCTREEGVSWARNIVCLPPQLERG